MSASGLKQTLRGRVGNACSCEGFRMPVIALIAEGAGTGVGKPPREEIAGG